MVATIRLGRQGRAVIPARFRRALQLDAGDELAAWLEDDRLVLQRRDDLERDLWEMFASVEGSLVDELIAKRRAEAEREHPAERS